MKNTTYTALLFSLLASSLAGAVPDYPGVVATELDFTPAPQCTLCHSTLAGGRGTVTRPVGAALRARGLIAYDQASLRAALAKLGQDRVDSDADGVTDVDELRAGSDPNAAPGTDAVTPETGCSAAVGVGWALVPGVLVLLRGGRGRSRRERRDRAHL